jgi:hypothetical protein
MVELVQRIAVVILVAAEIVAAAAAAATAAAAVCVLVFVATVIPPVTAAFTFTAFVTIAWVALLFVGGRIRIAGSHIVCLIDGTTVGATAGGAIITASAATAAAVIMLGRCSGAVGVWLLLTIRRVSTIRRLVGI